MIIGWLTPILDWLGIGLVPLLLIAILIILIVKD